MEYTLIAKVYFNEETVFENIQNAGYFEGDNKVITKDMLTSWLYNESGWLRQSGIELSDIKLID